MRQCRTATQLLPQPPEQENKPLVWPYWPIKLRSSSSHEEGCNRDWAVATKVLEDVCVESGLELVPDPGGAAYYGPKVSVQARDAIGRTWQMSTIQYDFNQPARFGLEYTGADGGRQQRVICPLGGHDENGMEHERRQPDGRVVRAEAAPVRNRARVVVLRRHERQDLAQEVLLVRPVAQDAVRRAAPPARARQNGRHPPRCGSAEA